MNFVKSILGIACLEVSKVVGGSEQLIKVPEYEAGPQSKFPTRPTASKPYIA
jgi:hypothetical protein